MREDIKPSTVSVLFAVLSDLIQISYPVAVLVPQLSNQQPGLATRQDFVPRRSLKDVRGILIARVTKARTMSRYKNIITFLSAINPINCIEAYGVKWKNKISKLATYRIELNTASIVLCCTIVPTALPNYIDLQYFGCLQCSTIGHYIVGTAYYVTSIL